ncbi:MAG: hypothetical protein IT375_27145 [Polyangiaceae bacterium]|nr:hypothetical protein [Polyangiaceae bacterium]
MQGGLAEDEASVGAAASARKGRAVFAIPGAWGSGRGEQAGSTTTHAIENVHAKVAAQRTSEILRHTA